MRVLFMGSPAFAVPALQALHGAMEVVAVVTQPDRPAGRGRLPKPSPVKLCALELGLPVLQPASLKRADARDQLAAFQPDLIVVAAFGQILGQALLDLPPYGSLNVHASLLPRWRGAAPVPAAILHGDTHSGVTIMKMDAGLDTGPILAQRSTPIQGDETTGQLLARLAVLGSQLLMQTIPDYLTGSLQPQPQAEDLATYAPMLRKQDGLLDFNEDAETLARQVRAFEPWPRSFFIWNDSRVQVRTAHAVAGSPQAPGTPLQVQGKPALAAASGYLVLDMLQPAGKSSMSGEAFLRGAPGFLGERLRLPEKGE